MLKIQQVTTSAAALTSTAYTSIYSVSTNGTLWGIWMAGAFNGTVEVLIDGITMLVSSVTAANYLAVQDDISTVVDSNATMSTLLFTTTSKLNELMFPFKATLGINARRAAGAVGTMTTYVKLATG